MKAYIYKDGLESERMKTRFLRQEDLAVWTDFFADADSAKFFPLFIKPNPAEGAQLWIDKILQRYADKRYGLQVMLDKNTNEFLGQCGLLAQTVDDVLELEVGYSFLRKHCGKGYATEAAKLFRDYGFQTTSVDSIISIIDPKNFPSQAVAERNGMKREKQTVWNEMDIFVYRITREEWLRLK